jgi:hypothetical protein
MDFGDPPTKNEKCPYSGGILFRHDGPQHEPTFGRIRSEHPRVRLEPKNYLIRLV